MSEDQVERIERDGSRPVPDPDPTYVARLGARLDAEWTARQRAIRPGSRALPWVAAAAACVLAFVAGLVIGDDGRQVELVTATEVADAFTASPLSTMPLSRGDQLPDGTVIQTGPDGRVVIGDDVLGPNQTGVIEDGRLQVVDESATTSSTAPPDSPRSTTSPSTSEPLSTTTTSRSPTTAPDDGPSAPEEQSLFLYVGHRQGFILAAWSEFSGDFSHYLLLRSGAESTPTWPAGPETTVVARVERGDDRGAAEMVDDPEGVRYRVVAIDDRGAAVAESPVVTPQDLEKESQSP